MIADSPGGMGPISGNMQLVYLILTSTVTCRTLKINSHAVVSTSDIHCISRIVENR
jgi:hypothetical protein